jgi:uncharacterized protein
MSNQLKIFLYLVFVVAIFWFVQSKFHIFDVKFNPTEEISTNDSKENRDEVPSTSNYVEIVVGANKSVKVNVELADSEEERELGLSFKKYLGDYDGMLFAFPSKTNVPFWMKDMQIPIDMIFFDDQGFIVDIKEAQAPCTATYCPSISPVESYKYVLEVNSGFVEKNAITKEGSLVLHIENID